jgi:N-acyl-D-amino-acid deacylase
LTHPGFCFGCVLIVSLFLSGCNQPEKQRENPELRSVDLIIRNGQVLDGVGGTARLADVLIDDATIVAVGLNAAVGFSAPVDIDARNRAVTPGFIDPHSHGDPFATPEFENFLAMGVTTITLGQDGDSPEVVDLRAWQDAVDEAGISVNLAMFVGHGTLRAQSGIGLDPDPDSVQLARMLEQLDADLDVAFGLSTGLEYNPGMHAGSGELIALARVVGARQRLIMSHLRSEDDDELSAALAELIDQGKYARVHVAHLKSVYGSGEARGREILSLLESARADGIRISADTYPYTASYAGLSLLFPIWAKTSDQFAVAKLERREELAQYLRERVLSRNGPAATLLGSEPFTGETLADLAVRFETPFEDVLIDVLGPDGGSAAYFVMDDALQATLLMDPSVAVSSDGRPTGFHPRGHGTFARIIERYVVDQERLSLAEAVRKMTSLPADLIGIKDRGRLLPGQAADIVVFDPEKVRERASYADPLKLADGFDLVIVNGKVARRDGVMQATRAGRVLKPAISRESAP